VWRGLTISANRMAGHVASVLRRKDLENQCQQLVQSIRVCGIGQVHSVQPQL